MPIWQLDARLDSSASRVKSVNRKRDTNRPPVGRVACDGSVFRGMPCGGGLWRAVSRCCASEAPKSGLLTLNVRAGGGTRGVICRALRSRIGRRSRARLHTVSRLRGHTLVPVSHGRCAGNRRRAGRERQRRGLRACPHEALQPSAPDRRVVHAGLGCDAEVRT
jgi:hypothetical protein